MSVVIGLGILAGLFMVLAFAMDDRHFVIKIVSLVFSVLIMLIMSSQILGDQDDCQVLLQNETITNGGNFTSYQYDRICFVSERPGTGESVWRLLNYFIRIIQWYLFGYLIYWIFDAFGINLLEKVKELFGK